MARRAPWLAALALTTAARASHAQTLWDEVRAPGWQQATAAAVAAREVLDVARVTRYMRGVPQPPTSQALMHTALVRAAEDLRDALSRAPTHLEGVYTLARVELQLEHLDEATQLLLRARVLARQGPLLADVLFQLATVYTRARRFEEAAALYGEQVQLPAPPVMRAVAMCNFAEVQMYQRRLDDAIETYRVCTSLEPRLSSGWWGLTVAYDRAGMGTDAMQAARYALAADPDMVRLQSDDVFFVPAYEIHYYLALGLEAMNKPELAVREWRRYLEAAEPDDPWRDRAQFRKTQLERAINAVIARRSRP